MMRCTFGDSNLWENVDFEAMEMKNKIWWKRLTKGSLRTFDKSQKRYTTGPCRYSLH